jgi:predicted  nucleic acid-binding Zn-ribbon protein
VNPVSRAKEPEGYGKNGKVRCPMPDELHNAGEGKNLDALRDEYGLAGDYIFELRAELAALKLTLGTVEGERNAIQEKAKLIIGNIQKERDGLYDERYSLETQLAAVTRERDEYLSVIKRLARDGSAGAEEYLNALDTLAANRDGEGK